MLRYELAALDALNQYNLPALALSPSPRAIHYEKRYIKGKYHCWDAVSRRTRANTQIDAHKVTTPNCTVIAQQKLLVRLCTKRVINTKTHRINCSLWLYCGSFLSLPRSILIRDVNYPCNSRQLICFVFSPPSSFCNPNLSIPKEAHPFTFLAKNA